MTNMYSKVEGMLYGHYRRKKRIDSLKSRLIRIENRIERLRRDIKECNIDLEDTMKAIDYSRDSIQSGGVTSNIERELERAVDNILRDIQYSIKDKYKTKSKIERLEKQVDYIDVLLEDLLEEELQILELRYSEGLSDEVIGDMINMSRPTVQRRRIKLINDLSEIMSK
jgi:DNA-directed RNA polymerase specialized sigma subunit